MTALARILEYRARTGELLSTRIEQLPRVFVAHEPVPCPWEQKGVVMREVMERAAGDRVELVDGVKVFFGEDWVLVLPDPEQPVVHVWAESDSDSKAHALAGTQARLVRTLVEQ
jgi:mannose-1-phosphate guanylyltransferase/phosphomannomutase